jgi:Domain of unknown function (DUF4434)
MMLKITGTFLDEITHDIPSNNWGPEDWARDFDAMRSVGIDTVILIRAGYRERQTFASKTLARHRAMLPADLDLVDLFLSESERCGFDFYFGTYDSGTHWREGRYEIEAEINRAFCEEAAERYAHRAAFAGWYFSHEINTFNDGMMRVYESLSGHLRRLKPVPMLISPYVKGIKQFGDQAIDFSTHTKEWDAVFSRLDGLVDVVAFQDGHVDYEVLPQYLEANRTLAAKYRIESWSNVESFDRDVPIKFPPIDFRKLKYKIEQAEHAGMSKLITFEFSHFMSPNSTYPAAHNLFRRYRDWIDARTA